MSASLSSASTSTNTASHRTLSLSHRHSHRSASSAAESNHASTAGGGGSRHRLRSPVANSICRQEARLGVTTSYPDLTLHSAAANGNVGLVQYALSAGQPVNSVLNGVLPLHAAASSGSETVVRMLIEAGADVNSPRLPRRYSNDRSKTSGISVGTAGSTPLHFAAANGHTGIIKLLLSYGADPRISEKHGITPEAIALQKGHLEAAEALRSFAPPPPSSSSVAGEDEDDVASLMSTRSSLRNLSFAAGKGKKKLLHPQRSFDALATKLHHHAASSTSLYSLASLASSGHGSPNPSTSQISLGAVSPDLSSLSTSNALVSRRISLPSSHPHGKSKAGSGSGSSTRRPSLPSVWEKAAHPRTALKQALGMSAVKQNGKTGVSAPGSMAAGSSSKGSLSSSLWEQGEGGLGEEDEQGGAELAERRRSIEVHRPLRQDSFQGVVTPARQDPPPSAANPPLSPKAHAAAKSGTVRTIPALARAASQHQFYRPRQSSQLSTQSFSGRRPSVDDDAEGTDPLVSDKVFEDDSPPPSTQASPSRPRAFSNPNPTQSGSRSPLLQQVHFSHHQQYAGPPALLRTREPSATSTVSNVSLDPTLASSRPSTAGGGALADNEFSSAESGGSSASRTRVPPPAIDVRRAWGNGAVSSSVAAVTAAAARNRSNSASTDGAFTRFSSSPGESSTYSGLAFSTYAPSASTAPTSVAPSSPGARAVVANGAAGVGGAGRKGLAPLYEAAARPVAGGGGVVGEDDEPVSSRAQARKRVQKAENDLLRYNPSLGGLSSGSSSSLGGVGSGKSVGATSGAGGKSLKEQLAAYGKSLRVEKELADKEEREKNGAGGFTFETIQTSSKAPTHLLAGSSSTKLLIPTVSSSSSSARLAPPTLAPPLATSKRGLSPSAFRSDGLVSSGAKTPAATPSKKGGTASPRADSPTSTRSAKSGSTVPHPPPIPSALPAATGPVLGQHGGVSFVGVQPPSSSHSSSAPHHPHLHPHAHSRTARSSHSSDRAASSTSASGSGLKIPPTTHAQVEEDRRRKEEVEARLPKAVRTVPERKKGLKRWFGGGGGSGRGDGGK
ncbi:hypothetical protein JCM8547_007163 [Rhodosporidiobolus lusitaniae]